MLEKIKYYFLKNKLKKVVRDSNHSVTMAKCKMSENEDDKLNILGNQTLSFSNTLFKFIDIKNMTDVVCYKRANIDRKLFSKIRSNEDYKPSKNTVFAFAIALKLNINETEELLKSAGYSLSHSFVTDIIVEYFIAKKKWDISLINIALDDYKQQPLGNV